MLAILKEPAYGLEIQCKAVSTFYSVAQICLDAVSLSHKEAQNLLGPHMNSWCSQFCHIIAQPATQVLSSAQHILHNITPASFCIYKDSRSRISTAQSMKC